MRALLITAIFACSCLNAATLTTIHAFSCTAEGIPSGALAIGETPDGHTAIYGATGQGGPDGYGMVYLLTPDSAGSWTSTTLHVFAGPDGIAPAGGVVLGPGQVLYGTTRNGGGDKFGGTVFSLRPPAVPGGVWTEQVLHRFTGPPDDGALPESLLAIGPGADGRMSLYGTTTRGGASGGGTVFALTPPLSPGGDWQETVLYSFTKSGHQGYNPFSGVVLGPGSPKGPSLFGVTGFGGGGAGAVGSVYVLTPPTASEPWRFEVLYRFSPNGSGSSPGPIVTAGGAGAPFVLFGTTAEGSPTSSGTVYSLMPPATSGNPWIESQLYEFIDRADGAAPEGGVVAGADGTLYGTASQGGPAGYGVVFSLTPPTSPDGQWKESTVYGFTGGADGAFPQAPIAVGKQGILYSTTSNGGDGLCGTVFSLKP
ncbi:MAG TPA: choice-of-anchor tandem repeat GloVer-containing protein [Bryobacteraceae bacterium]|nr:choice-of-anchor tandem repeat GloVer-containing protein [Bryobacteraceae bacterium]